jgi:CMP-N-acetylneuraminic acid synthetase
MNTLAIIPSRAGSKRLPGKNMRLLNNFPLIHYTLVQAEYCNLINDSVVTTDDREVKAYAKKFGFRVIDRPNELATDDARSEDVVVHAIRTFGNQFSRVVLLQPTSPLRSIDDISACIRLSEYGGVVSVTEFCNYGYKKNGAVYVWSVQKVVQGDFSFCCTHIMPRDRSIDIDTEDDFNEAQRLMNEKNRV